MPEFHTDDRTNESNAQHSHATATPTAPRLEFAFEVHLELGPPQVLNTRGIGADRAAIYVKQGTVDGPRLRGTVVADSGGDWARMRPDGVLDFDARYLLRAEDGTLIYLTNLGYRWSSPHVNEELMRGQPVDPSRYYMRVTPRFEVAEGPHDWLSRHVFVGIGERLPKGNVIRYFVVL